MRKIAIAAICVGTIMCCYIIGSFAHVWILSRSSSNLHDTYYVVPHWHGPAIFVLTALGLIFWGIWKLGTWRRN